MTTTTTTGRTTSNVYERPDCGESTTEHRCPDCHLFTQRLRPGGPCPSCDEPILTDEILTTTGRSTPRLTQKT